MTGPSHGVSRKISEFINYPDHAARTTSAEFSRNRRQLLVKLDLPCFICQSRDHREVHHLIEWSLFPAIDTEKMLDTLHLFDPYGFTHQMGEKPIESPDDIRNLLVLCGHCEVDGTPVPGGHHRGINAGIHELTFPIWIAQRCAKDGMSITKAILHVQDLDAVLRGGRKPQPKKE